MNAKRVFASVLFTALLALTLAACNEPAKPQVAVIDPGQIFQNSQSGQKAQQALQSLNAEFQEKMSGIEKDFTSNATTEEEANKAMNELRNTMVAKQQNIVKVLEDGLQKAMENYRLRSGVVMILPAEQVMSFDPGLDATKEVTADLDKLDLALPAAEAPEKAPAE